MDCVFCEIVAGRIPATVVAETEHALAFRDIQAQAPTHVLVIPRRHHPDMAALASADPDTAAEVLGLVGTVAAQEGLAERGYRSMFNTGREGGQTVFHAHVHVLGGRPLGAMLVAD